MRSFSQNTLKVFVVLAIFGFFANTNLSAGDSNTTPNVSVTGSFYINGQWTKGKLVSQAISIHNENGTVMASTSGPWQLNNLENQEITSGDKPISVPYRDDRGGDSGNKKHSKEKIISTNDGLSITSDDVLDIQIYDLLGKSVYAVKSKNASIDKNTLNLTNGTYMLRSVDKEGKENITTFMFDGNSFMFSNPKE